MAYKLPNIDSGLITNISGPLLDDNNEMLIQKGGGGGSISKPTLSNILRPIKDVSLPKPNAVPENKKPQPSLARPEIEQDIVSDENVDVVSEVLGLSSLPYIQNPYPTEVGTDPSPNYTVKDETIRFTGKYSENFLEFKTKNIDDILSLNINEYPTSFNFIVEFVNGNERDYYASPILLGELKAELNAGNPYKNRSTVPVIKFDFSFIENYSKEAQFKIPEDYAEVTVTKTLTTKEDILRHIDWMVSSDETLRRASDIGAWKIELTKELGMDHSKELDNLNKRILNEESNISDNLNQSGENLDGDSDGTSLGNENNVGDFDDNDNQKPDNSSGLLYPPFGVPGRRTGERRKNGGTTYRWSKVRNTWIVLRS